MTDLEPLRDLFPIASKIWDRQILRVQALKRLQRTRREEDESDQLKKVKTREILSSMVRLEEWR